MEVFQVERLGRGPAPTQARLHGLKGTGISNPAPPGVPAELWGGQNLGGGGVQDGDSGGQLQGLGNV